MGSVKLGSGYPDYTNDGFFPDTLTNYFDAEGLDFLTATPCDDLPPSQILEHPRYTWLHNSSQASGLSIPAFQLFPQVENFTATPLVASEPIRDLTYGEYNSFDWSLGTLGTLGTLGSVVEYPVLMGHSFDTIDPTLVDEPSRPNPMIPESPRRPQSIDPEHATFSLGYDPFVSTAVFSPVTHIAIRTTISNVTNYNHDQPGIVVDQSSSTQVPVPTAAPPGRFLCGYQGCTKHFGHAKDRDRHTTKHAAPQFPCTFQGCSRSGAMAFYRQDKLRDHVRRKHGLKV